MLQGRVVLAAEGVVLPSVGLVEAGASGGVAGDAGVVAATEEADVVPVWLPVVPVPVVVSTPRERGC